MGVGPGTVAKLEVDGGFGGVAVKQGKSCPSSSPLPTPNDVDVESNKPVTLVRSGPAE